MRDKHGGSQDTGLSADKAGVRSMTTSKAQTSIGKRCWPGAFRPCWRLPARPRPNGTQERWWLPSASWIGCAGWGSTHKRGTGSTFAVSRNSDCERRPPRTVAVRGLVKRVIRLRLSNQLRRVPPVHLFPNSWRKREIGGVYGRFSA